MLLELNKKQRAGCCAGMTLTTIILSLFVGLNLMNQLILLAVACYLFTGERPTTVYSIVMAIPRDFTAAVKFFEMNFILYRWEKRTIASIFQDIVKKHPNKIAFMMDDIKLTFQEAENLSNQVAAYFKSINFKHGDTIALIMENRPEYACFWIGLSKLGVITALVNTNLRKDTLLHSIKAANSKAIIVGGELAEAVKEILADDSIKDLTIFQYSDEKQRTDEKHYFIEGSKDLCSSLKGQTTTLPDEAKTITARDKMVYIYTSGTTGLPKAAVITNLRYMFMSLGCNIMLSIRNDDILYNALPLYHTAGGIVGVGSVLLRGNTMAMRKRFSASNFWTDCIKYDCTVAQYIGELCRYLLSTPSKPQDTQHKVRMMFGNGLRPQIWKQFVSRFNIEQIGEVYGSTEGNSNLVNIDSTVGAVGFVPRFAKKLYPVTLVRCDEDTGEPLRNAEGRCMPCEAGEPGVFLGKINPKKAVIAFEGYADKKASEKKMLRDVFKKGDLYFNSGDILIMDIMGYFYFKDRTGDTFRWRGENVSTSEVEGVISNIVGLHDCVVYGVDIPHVEGKAGMAAIVEPKNQIDLENFSAGIRGSLAPYARPLFVRILKEVPMTGTFKLKKRDLQLEGFNIHKIKDPIYFLNNDGIFRKFSEKNYDDVMNGTARL